MSETKKYEEDSVEHTHTIGEQKEEKKSLSMYVLYNSSVFFLLLFSIRVFFPATSQTESEKEGTLEICTQKHYTRNCEHDGLSKTEEKKKKKKRKKKEEFFSCRKRRTIALFNPDRATNKHVLPSFKKVPVFFFLFIRYVAIDRERKKKKNCSEHHHHENQQEKNE